MIWIIIAGNIIVHEGAHIVVGVRLGGQWRGLRIGWARVAVILDIEGLTIPQLRQVAAAGLAVDGIFWLGFVGWVGCVSPVPALAWWGSLWFTALLLLNATPWIRGSDGWRVWHHHNGGVP